MIEKKAPFSYDGSLVARSILLWPNTYIVSLVCLDLSVRLDHMPPARGSSKVVPRVPNLTEWVIITI